jgi:hypothetical protein
LANKIEDVKKKAKNKITKKAGRVPKAEGGVV